MKSKKQMTEGVSKSLTGTAIDRISLRLENAKRNRDPKAHREAMAAYNKLSDRHKTMGDQRGYFSKRLLTPPKPKPKTKAGKGKTRKTSLSAEQIIKIAELVSAINTFAEDHGLVQKGGSKLPPHKNGRFDGYMGNKPRRPSNAKYMSDYRQGKKEWRTSLAKKKKRSLKRKHRGGGSSRKK